MTRGCAGSAGRCEPEAVAPETPSPCVESLFWQVRPVKDQQIHEPHPSSSVLGRVNLDVERSVSVIVPVCKELSRRGGMQKPFGGADLVFLLTGRSALPKKPVGLHTA